MMWQYLVADYGIGSVGGGYWRVPPDLEALRMELGNSLQQGCAALGQHGWELAGVTLAVGGPVNTYTLFFKKPA
jgi:hypothetical protein